MTSLFVCLVIAQSTIINNQIFNHSNSIQKFLAFTSPNFYLIFSYWYSFALIHTIKAVDSEILEDYLNRFLVLISEIIIIYFWLRYFNFLKLVSNGQILSISKYLKIEQTDKLSLFVRIVFIFLIWAMLLYELKYQYPKEENFIYTVLNWQLGIFLSLLSFSEKSSSNR